MAEQSGETALREAQARAERLQQQVQEKDKALADARASRDDWREALCDVLNLRGNVAEELEDIEIARSPGGEFPVGEWVAWHAEYPEDGSIALRSLVSDKAAGELWGIGLEQVRDRAEAAEKRVAEAQARTRELEGALRAARSVIDRDRTGLAAGLNAIRGIVGGWRWLAIGEWGSYDYTQRTEETLRREFGECLDAILATLDKSLRESGTLATEACRSIDATLRALAQGTATPQTENAKQGAAGAATTEEPHASTAGTGGSDVVREVRAREVLPRERRVFDLRAPVSSEGLPQVQEETGSITVAPKAPNSSEFAQGYAACREDAAVAVERLYDYPSHWPTREEYAAAIRALPTVDAPRQTTEKAKDLQAADAATPKRVTCVTCRGRGLIYGDKCGNCMGRGYEEAPLAIPSGGAAQEMGSCLLDPEPHSKDPRCKQWISDAEYRAGTAASAAQPPPDLPRCTPMRCRVGLDYGHCQAAGHLTAVSAREPGGEK